MKAGATAGLTAGAAIKTPSGERCPWGESLLLAGGTPWVLADVGVVLESPTGWRVLGVDPMGWRLRHAASPVELTISLSPASADLLQDRKTLLRGWQQRGFVIEQVSDAAIKSAPALALRMRSPEQRPVRVLYIPKGFGLLVLTMEGPIDALAGALDAPLQAVLEGISFLDAPVARWSPSDQAWEQGGVGVRFGREGQIVPLPGSSRIGWLDVGAQCPLWAQLEVRALSDKPPESPQELDRLTRDLVASAVQQWPDATPEPLLPGRLGGNPAMRFALRLQTAEPAHLSMPLSPPAHANPQPWSVLGVVVVRASGPSLLIRAWVLGDDFAGAEQRLSRWLERVTPTR